MVTLCFRFLYRKLILDSQQTLGLCKDFLKLLAATGKIFSLCRFCIHFYPISNFQTPHDVSTSPCLNLQNIYFSDLSGAAKFFSELKLLEDRLVRSPATYTSTVGKQNLKTSGSQSRSWTHLLFLNYMIALCPTQLITQISRVPSVRSFFCAVKLTRTSSPA